jgi:hypothetical protein
MLRAKEINGAARGIFPSIHDVDRIAHLGHLERFTGVKKEGIAVVKVYRLLICVV